MSSRDKPANATAVTAAKAKPRRGHTMADHALGALVAHVHAPGEEHDHDHDHDGMDLLPHGASDGVSLTSIGIDIGSSGTQVAFARLRLEGSESNLEGMTPGTPAGEAKAQGSVDRTQVASDGGAASGMEGLTPPPMRRSTRQRDTIWQSPIYLTPFVTGSRIDEAALGRLIDHAFAGAGLTADDVDCGVVILTGAARERGNAEAIGRELADRCGDIVSASAGHHMEARLAAHGSGAAARSAEFGQRWLNIDIGGATTKLAVCEDGEITATAALAIGGRLVATDRTDRIVRLEPAGRQHAADAGIAWEEGGQAPWSERQAVGRHMADRLVAALTGRLSADEMTALHVTEPLASLYDIDAVIVSGGVGEYVYGREKRSFSDLGLPLGRALAAHIDAGALPWPLMPATECIRATVLGASSYSVQLSGRTGFISNPAALLPRRNLPVVQPCPVQDGAVDSAAFSRAIFEALRVADLSDATADQPGDQSGDCVLALRWTGEPDHARLLALGTGVRDGMAGWLAAGRSLYVVVDCDIAGSLGALLRDELGVMSDVLVLDGIALSDLDHVDLGRIRLPSGSVPVTIKTLVFREEERGGPRRRAR
jgi:ethanolamine utilization protein EutA